MIVFIIDAKSACRINTIEQASKFISSYKDFQK